MLANGQGDLFPISGILNMLNDTTLLVIACIPWNIDCLARKISDVS